MTSTTTFDITEKDGTIFFTVSENEFAEDEMSWCSSEVFYPSEDELTELYTQLHRFLQKKGIVA
jgi:hypothetical protein